MSASQAFILCNGSFTNFSRKENIFKPLGINASFHLTPELKAKYLPLTYRNGEGKLETLADQPECRIIPQEPSEGSCV